MQPGAHPRFAYVILAHTAPESVVRLVRRIRRLSSDGEVVVRFGPEAPFEPSMFTEAGAHVLQSPIEVEWGTWSQTESELEAIRETRRRLPDVTHVVVVSGQDYPIRDLTQWEATVADVDALLEPMPITPVSVERRWYVLRAPGLPCPVRRVLAALGWRVPRLTGGRVHVNPSPREGDPRWWVGVPRPVRGGIAKAALWKVVSARAVDSVLARHEEQVAEREYVRRCRLPDELYSPTALVADPTLVVRHGTTSFTSWPPGASSPAWLTCRHVPLAIDSGAPFARKLAPDASADLVDALDGAVCAPR